MEEGQDATETPLEHIGSQDQFPADATTVNRMKPHRDVQTVTEIAKGFRESLKNVQNYRLSMHEEIKDILKKQVVTFDRKALPNSWSPPREEE